MVAPVPAHISKFRARLLTPPRRRFPLHCRPSHAASGVSEGAHFAKGCKSAETATLTTFRMNTCKSVSKQSTLTTFRMNTYEKKGEGGTESVWQLGLTLAKYCRERRSAGWPTFCSTTRSKLTCCRQR